MIRPLFLAGFWCSFIVCGTLARASTAIPFTTEDGMVRVNASIDGGAPSPMLVDLGAGINVLTSTAAGRVHFKPATSFSARRMRGDTVSLPIGQVSSIVLGPSRVEHAWVASWAALDGHGIDGLISASQFSDVPVTFDYVNDVLTFEDTASMAARTAKMTRVPLVLKKDQGIAVEPFVAFDFGNGQVGLCEMDTGSQGIYLDSRFASKLGFDARATTGRLDSVAVHGAPSTAHSSQVVRFEKLIYDCNVGNDFWKGRRFTLDMPDSALFI